MKKLIYPISSAFLAAAIATSSLVSAADLGKALSTLPQNDEWSIMAYASQGQSVGQDFLRGSTGNAATDIEKRVLAITAIGGNPRTFGSEDFVAKLKAMFDGTQIGDPSLLNDDIFGVLALSSVGENGSIIDSVKNHILANQNSDGGWGFAKGGSSDSNTTAMAVAALKGNSAGQNYLNQSQDQSGGFGFTPGQQADGASTAWVIMGLNAVGGAPSDAKNFLENLQLSDGSFKWKPNDSSGSGLVTAYAVIALSGNTLPIRVVSAPAPSPSPAPTPTPSPTPTPTPSPSPSPSPSTSGSAGVGAPAASVGATLTSDCFIPIFHTDFDFPKEGGKVVKVGSQLYFHRDYLAECKNTPAGASGVSTAAPSPSPQPGASSQSSLGSSLTSSCFIPIVHTDFPFPPEGGKIVKVGSQLYFHRDYLAECKNTPAGASGVSTPSPAPSGSNQDSSQAQITITISVRDRSNNLFSGSLPIKNSATVLDALHATGLNLEVTSSGGTFVRSIGGIGPSGNSGWQYAVNGAVPDKPADQYAINSNDNIQWFYGPPGQNPY